MIPLSSSKVYEYDYVIVGSGIAGLYTALLANQYGKVLILTKGKLDDCNTKFAQGGIAAAIGPNDSPELHIADTLAAGAGLSDPVVATILAKEGPDRIQDLIDYGVPFDTLGGTIALAREGAHTVPRVIHAGGDATGARVEMILSDRVKEAGIEALENEFVTSIETKEGILVGLRVKGTNSDTDVKINCKALVLATGGAGQLFRFNTNPKVATGDGVALAYLAGAEIVDMEFFQFHPTALRKKGVHPFLISEAIRGEGGILRAPDGRRFMREYDTREELASRDIVARAILTEMRKASSDHVYLDVSHLPARKIVTRFPSIYRFCLSKGIDITRYPIPVAPAAHYMMGGVRTGIWGETIVKGLYACGEVACTGLHGANRLASNSLIEALVFGKRIVEAVSKGKMEPLVPAHENNLSSINVENLIANYYSKIPSLSLNNLKNLMWDNVAMVRDKEGLTKAACILTNWLKITRPHIKHINKIQYETYNMILVAQKMALAALEREESRGVHYRTDFPFEDESWLRHIVFRRENLAI